MSENNNGISRNFKGIWIPKEIWLNENLSIQAKALWGEINSLHCEEKGGCFASSDYLCKFMQVKYSRLKELLKELRDFNLIENVSFDGRERIMRAIVPTPNYGGQQTATPVASRGPENRPAPGRKTGQQPLKPHIYRENKDKNKDIAQTAPQLRQKVPEISFDNQKFQGISDDDLKNWKEIFPSSDIELQIKLMEEWCKSNPSKSKSKKLWRKFITNWLRRNNEEIINKQSYKPQNNDRRVKEKDGSYSKHQAEDLF